MMQQSKIGITSLLIAVLVGLYILMLFGLFSYTGFLHYIAPQTGDIFEEIPGFILLIFVTFGIPAIGFIIGMTFGLVGLLRTDKKRLFAGAGFLLNFLPFILAILYLFYLHNL